MGDVYGTTQQRLSLRSLNTFSGQWPEQRIWLCPKGNTVYQRGVFSVPVICVALVRAQHPRLRPFVPRTVGYYHCRISLRVLTQGSQGFHHILSKEWYNEGGLAVLQPTSCRASTSVMYHCGNSGEQPLMWAISYEVHVVSILDCKVRPSFRDNCSGSCAPHSIKDHAEHLIGIFEYNAPEADVDRRWPLLEKR